MTRNYVLLYLLIDYQSSCHQTGFVRTKLKGLDAETQGIRHGESLGWWSSSPPFPRSSGSPTEIVEKEWWESERTLGE